MKKNIVFPSNLYLSYETTDEFNLFMSVGVKNSTLTFAFMMILKLFAERSSVAEELNVF